MKLHHQHLKITATITAVALSLTADTTMVITKSVIPALEVFPMIVMLPSSIFSIDSTLEETVTFI